MEAGIFAALDGNTMLENAVAAKLKHLSAQAAIELQSPIALSQGSALGGQQSCPIADMSVISADLSADLRSTPAPAAAGSRATDRAIISAIMVRARFMDRPWQQK